MPCHQRLRNRLARLELRCRLRCADDLHSPLFVLINDSQREWRFSADVRLIDARLVSDRGKFGDLIMLDRDTLGGPGDPPISRSAIESGDTWAAAHRMTDRVFTAARTDH